MSNEKTETRPDADKPAEPPRDMVSVTHGSVVINGVAVSYTATAGTLVINEEDPENKTDPKARTTIFYIAYTRNDIDDPAERPLTFSFNGGPGSSSVWLHLGLLGPRRVHMRDEQPTPPPYRVVANEFSLLDVSDLVFIDPVSTGYSRAVAGEKPDQFHQFTKDIETVGEFIRLYTTRSKRWNSPKFLIGESYGTTRAAGVAGYLQQRHGYYLNGIMLVSSILDFITADFDHDNDLPFIMFLPTYTATAWYHRRLPADLQDDLQSALAEASDFASRDYVLALMQGDALPADERARIVARLARLTGLSAEFIERSNLRIDIFRFVKELLRDQRRTVGRLDSRFTGVDRDAAGERFEYDPSYAVIQGPYTAALNDYVRRELKFESDLPYEILTGRVRPWKYDQHENRYVSVSETLRATISQNPFLRVFVASGYYDLATPYFATEYTFNHLGLDSELRANITMAYYEAGHMMYVHGPSLARLKADLAAFIAAALPE